MRARCYSEVCLSARLRKISTVAARVGVPRPAGVTISIQVNANRLARLVRQ